MPEFGAQDVKRLRDSTGAGMMDAKRALTDADGDFDKAADLLRERGQGKAAERADRENVQGAVAVASNGTAAALVELKSETDFVARSPDFLALADELAQLVLENGEAAIEKKQDAVDTLKIQLKENIDVGRVVRFEAADGNVLDGLPPRAQWPSRIERGAGGAGQRLEGLGPRHRPAHQLQPAERVEP